MKNKAIFEHDLVLLLRSFSEKEMVKFRAFLVSPYFTFRKSLNILFDELTRFHPLYNHVKLTRKYLYNKVYPNREFNDDSMRVLLSALNEAALKFLKFEYVARDSNACFNLIRELRLRDLPNMSRNQLNKIVSSEIANKKVDGDFFMQSFRHKIETINVNIALKKLTSVSGALQIAEDLKLASSFMIIYFVTELTANYTNLIVNADRFNSASLEERIYSTIRGFSPTNLFAGFKGTSKYDFMIDVYEALINAFKKRGNWKVYIKFKKEVNKHLNSFNHDEASFQYYQLISCAILGGKYGKFKDKFDTERLMLYEDFLNKNYYIDNKVKYVPSNLYRSIIFHAVKMNALAWLYKVISEAEPKLAPDDRDNLQSYAWAQYHFASGNFDESLKHINLLSPDNFIFKYDIYEMKLRIFFDRMQYEGAFELLHSYRQFIRKDPMINPARKTWHRNFASYIEKLIKASHINSRIDIDFTISKLQKLGNVYHKDWLLNRFYALTDTASAGYRKSV